MEFEQLCCTPRSGATRHIGRGFTPSLLANVQPMGGGTDDCDPPLHRHGGRVLWAAVKLILIGGGPHDRALWRRPAEFRIQALPFTAPEMQSHEYRQSAPSLVTIRACPVGWASAAGRAGRHCCNFMAVKLAGDIQEQLHL